MSIRFPSSHIHRMKTDSLLTIMVVDDNAQMRGILKETLGPVPCSFIECSNGRDAVDTYSTSKPDWVLMDVRMEPMNGIAALTEIRRQHPEARVIVVTSAIEDAVRTAAFKAGAVAFVRKESLNLIPDLIMNSASQPHVRGNDAGPSIEQRKEHQ